jgi:predicted  nucleic acid-binding Zn-ribbon protein
MSGPAVIFRTIHRLRRHAHDLQEQLERIPRQLKAHQAKVTRQEEALHSAQEGIRRLKVEVQSKEKTLKERHGQIAKFQKQRDEATSKKEYDALQTEMSAVRTDVARLEDEILNGIAEGEERTAQLPELERTLKQGKEDLARLEQEAGARRASLAGQLQQVQEQLKAAEADIPPKLREQYNRIVTAKGADALAPVRDRTCSACYTEITVQSSNDLVQDLFVLCKSCGRILYLPEEAARPVPDEAG